MKSILMQLKDHIKVIDSLEGQFDNIDLSLSLILKTLSSGNKILICGNGGSASDAQHLSAELMVKYNKERKPIPAISLTTDTSILTAHSNDFHFDTVFSRQIEALGNAGDCLIAISTSGNSNNVVNAVKTANRMGLTTISLSGMGGGILSPLTDANIIVDSYDTARIQEAHIFIIHHFCFEIDVWSMK